jgi:hypothetical protein
MITYRVYRHPHDLDPELLDSFESVYSISEGTTIEIATGQVLVKKVIVHRDGSVDLYAHAVLGMSLL